VNVNWQYLHKANKNDINNPRLTKTEKVKPNKPTLLNTQMLLRKSISYGIMFTKYTQEPKTNKNNKSRTLSTDFT
jgi:hypothetical protein